MHPLNPDTAIPAEIMREARKIDQKWFGSHHDSEILATAIARALMARDQRAAAKAYERAAEIAKKMLECCDGYSWEAANDIYHTILGLKETHLSPSVPRAAILTYGGDDAGA
jgi:phosphoribosyl-ATP pyrophosphohydrolase